MTTIKTVVMVRKPAQFDMCGQFLGYPLKEIDAQISQGLAKRILQYAVNRLKSAGLNVDGWQVSVETMDGDERPSERHYSVTWENKQGTKLHLDQIHMKNGWPFLDHRFRLEE